MQVTASGSDEQPQFVLLMFENCLCITAYHEHVLDVVQIGNKPTTTNIVGRYDIIVMHCVGNKSYFIEQRDTLNLHYINFVLPNS